MRAARKFIAPPWLVQSGYKAAGLLQVDPHLQPGTVMQRDWPSVSRLRAWDGSRAACAILLRYQGWRWAIVVTTDATVFGEHLIARGQRGCPHDAKADLAHYGIKVLP